MIILIFNLFYIFDIKTIYFFHFLIIFFLLFIQEKDMIALIGSNSNYVVRAILANTVQSGQTTKREIVTERELKKTLPNGSK